MSYFSFLLLIIVVVGILIYAFIKYNLVRSRITVIIIFIIFLVVMHPTILDFSMFLKGGIELSDRFSCVYSSGRYDSYTLTDSKNQEYTIPDFTNIFLYYSMDKKEKQDLVIRYLPNTHHILNMIQKEEYLRNKYYFGTKKIKNGEVYYVVYTDTDNLFLELIFGSIILTILFFINKYQGLLPFPAYVIRPNGRS